MSPDTPCPSAEFLRRSLDPDDPMPEAERRGVEAHVERCERGCKRVLDALLRDHTVAAGPEETREFVQPARADPAARRRLPSIPGYEIHGELGRGGMGVVYKARQLKLNRLVALKMILAGAHADAEELARFRTEAEAVAALQHPNVVQIHEIGEQDGRPYFSLEYVEGGNLARKLAGEPQSPGRAAELVETLARAVDFAHRRGIVHRDLKPANVLLTAEGLPKLTDFGLVKRMDGASDRTRPGAVVGTPSYMAPEQAGGRSKEVGPATDVYALGAILYEMLTGRPPFRAATPVDTIVQVVNDDPVPPRQLQSKAPRDLETICLKCLEKKPARRYASAAELADDLGRWRRGEPVRARPPSLAYWLGKQAMRHRAPLAVAAAMLLVVAAVTAAAFVQVLGARDEAVRKGNDLEKKEGELRTALDDKQAALNGTRQTLDSLQKQLSILARSYADRSEVEYRQGNFNDSLNLMLRAYEVAPPDDSRRALYVRLIGARGDSAGLLTLPHGGCVGTASFSPDGRTVLAAGKDKTARLWDAAGGQELRRLAHDDWVLAASFSPDGRKVVTGSRDRTARLWDAETGKELHRLPHGAAVVAASFSPDGRTVLTASYDKTARLWDAQTGAELQRLRHDDCVEAASFSPDGHTVVTASWDKTARLWDADSGKELLRLPHPAMVVSASFSADGRTLLTGCRDVSARLWDLGTGKEVQRFTHDAGVDRASFSPDGRTVVTASWDKTARLWDVATGKELQRFSHENFVYTACFSPDGRTVVTTSLDKTARLWDVADGKELMRFRHDGKVNTACFSPDGRRILSASDDRTVRLWDPTVGQARLRLAHDGWVSGASFSPDGRTILTAAADRTARLWDAESGKELRRLRHEDAVNAASFSPDGRTVVTASWDHTARLWDAADGRELHRLPHDDKVYLASFSPDGRRLVTAGGEKDVHLWDAASGAELHRLRLGDFAPGFPQGVDAASFSPDGRTVMAAGLVSEARLWDVESGELRQRFRQGQVVVTAAFSPDGRSLLTAALGSGERAHVWDVADGTERWQFALPAGVMQPSQARGRAASFSPDGRTLLLVGMDPVVRLWDAAPDGRVTAALTHEDRVVAAWFSPDGRTVLTASWDKTARLWDAATGKEFAQFRHEDALTAASFSPDGLAVVTAGNDKTARVWDARFLSTPDDPARLRAWVLVRTGRDITDDGMLRPLDPAEWERQRQTLEDRGGDWRTAR